jgi:hypothetical protein
MIISFYVYNQKHWDYLLTCQRFEVYRAQLHFINDLLNSTRPNINNTKNVMLILVSQEMPAGLLYYVRRCVAFCLPASYSGDLGSKLRKIT